MSARNPNHVSDNRDCPLYWYGIGDNGPDPRCTCLDPMVVVTAALPDRKTQIRQRLTVLSDEISALNNEEHDLVIELKNLEAEEGR